MLASHIWKLLCTAIVCYRWSGTWWHCKAGHTNASVDNAWNRVSLNRILPRFKFFDALKRQPCDHTPMSDVKPGSQRISVGFVLSPDAFLADGSIMKQCGEQRI